MSKITVYNVELYDATNDQVCRSKRMATRAGIALMRGWEVPGSAHEIDETQLEPGYQWTPIDFDPRPPRAATFPNGMRP